MFSKEEEDITIPKIIATPEEQETENEQEREIKIKDETPSARKVDTGQESDEEYQLAVENLSDDKVNCHGCRSIIVNSSIYFNFLKERLLFQIPLNEREKSEKVQELEADAPSVIGKLSSNTVRDGEAAEGGDEKEITEIDAAMQNQVKNEQENLSHVLHSQDILPEGRESTKDEEKLLEAENKLKEDLGKENVSQVKQLEAIAKNDEGKKVHEDAGEKNVPEGPQRGVMGEEKVKEITADEKVLKAERREKIMDEERETLSDSKQIGVVMEVEIAKEIKDDEQVPKAEKRKENTNEGKEILSEDKQIGAVMREELEKQTKDDEVSKSERREEITVERKEILSEGKQTGAVMEEKEETIDVIPEQEVGEIMSVTSEKDKLFGKAIIPGETRQAEKGEEREITNGKLEAEIKPVFSISGNEDKETLHADELNVEVPIAAKDAQILPKKYLEEEKAITESIGMLPPKKLRKEVAIAEDEQISPIEEVEEDTGEKETVEAELDKGMKPTILQVKVGKTVPKYLAPVLGRKEMPHIPEKEKTVSDKDSACLCDPEVSIVTLLPILLYYFAQFYINFTDIYYNNIDGSPEKTKTSFEG